VNVMNLQPESCASTVLVLTEPGDTTADLVVKELDQRGAQVFRVDAAESPCRSGSARSSMAAGVARSAARMARSTCVTSGASMSAGRSSSSSQHR
jgi:hypothetical protein